MTTRGHFFAILTTAILVCSPLMLLGLAPGLLAAKPPNVLLIISDDQAWTDYGFMQHPHIRTPNLDRLATQSLTYTRGYVPSSLCRPSLATIITGLYPHQHGIVGNDPAPLPGQTLRQSRQDERYSQLRLKLIERMDDLQTLPRMLAEKGYVSHQSGKWWEGSYRRGGFTDGMTRGFPQPGGRHGDDGLAIGREGLQPIQQFVRDAKESNTPFFIWYAPFLPHTPHTPPQRLLEHYQQRTDSLPIAKYWAMCQWFDETCGQLLQFIDDEGLDQETLVVYVTDNGWINLPHRSAYAPRSKRSPYEGGVRTPIMFRWPGKIEPSMNQTDLASSIDLVPTILKACGLPTPDGLPGIDLTDQSAVENREQIFGEIFTHDVADLNRPAANLLYRWVIHDPWKLIQPHTNNEDQTARLYDILQDPLEVNNQADDHPLVVKRLQDKLIQWWNPTNSAEN